MRKVLFCMILLLVGCSSQPRLLGLAGRSSPPAPTPAVAQPKLEPPRTLYTTISEVLKQPLLFNGQIVRLKGKVARVQPPPQSDQLPTVFDLVETTGKTVSVKTLKRAEVQDGWVVTVEGRMQIGDASAVPPRDVGMTDARLVAVPKKVVPPPRPADPSLGTASPPGVSQDMTRGVQRPAETETGLPPTLLSEEPLPEELPGKDTPLLPQSPSEEKQDKGRIF